ncbi:SLAM family member 5-like isoform X2 [Stegostoma tigrinum]|uniref:SLAM family member 5-like isoform X2 n=1 Tax=Stegostoma tigrinum TaxID=3053191 RepID=UPI0028707D1E|nr:SLAM family member 5-like isoform X2 [Stegostoma tigrinum]
MQRCRTAVNRKLQPTAPRMLTIWLLLAFFKDLAGLGLADGNIASSRLLNGSLGQSFSLPVHIPFADPLILTWDFRSSDAGKKNQICTKSQNNPAKCSDDFRQRVRLNLSDYSLEIKSLTKSDQGWYEVNARSEQVVHAELMELRVYEPVSIPSIEVTDMLFNETCNVSLKCSVENGSDLTYSWWTGGEEVRTDKLQSVTHDGRRLQLLVYPNSTNRAYNCTVKNPVSEATCMITLEPHCKQAPNTEGTSEPALYADIKRSSNTRDESQGHLCQLDISKRQQGGRVQLTTVYDEIKFNPDVPTPMTEKGQEASANA